MPIPRIPFGRTGHDSSRLIFGAAALANVTQDDADRALERLLAAGINHIDTAAAYGEAELRIGPWMDRHRRDFFLATKTGERSFAAAREEIQRSLERLRTDRIDLLQLHNLVAPEDREQAFAADGALRAAVEAREAGLVRFIGVTGHGTRVPALHRASLERFPFDSVLLPYNWSMLRDETYAEEFRTLHRLCAERGVAVQTIKSVARRRWREDEAPTHSTWYRPLEDPDEIERAVHWALGCPGIFVNSASDLRLLDSMIEAAECFRAAPEEAEMRSQHDRAGVEPLFIRGHASRSATRG